VAEELVIRPGMAVAMCVFYEGAHYPGPDCPHEQPEDETGPIQPVGWTVQQQP
jgi:hypothetical protein